MTPKFFPTQTDFRQWLEENHAQETEIIVGYYNVKSGKKCMTWSESVDEALCFGWIDGVRRKIDAESYSNRFTPRRANSNWSAVNIAKVAELTAKGLMMPAGIAAFEKRKDEKSAIYAYEQKDAALPEEYEQQFRANEKAWEFFQAQPAWYRRTAIWQVISAKREETRLKRLGTLIEDSAGGRTIAQLTRNNKSDAP